VKGSEIGIEVPLVELYGGVSFGGEPVPNVVTA
jgi:hypothetical protein